MCRQGRWRDWRPGRISSSLATGIQPCATCWCAAATMGSRSFSGDRIYCKKTPLKTVVVMTTHLENRPDWDQPLIRLKAWMAASGECVKADGWLLPSSDRIYPRQIQDLVQHHIEDSHGPNVEWRFIGRAMNCGILVYIWVCNQILPPMTELEADAFRFGLVRALCINDAKGSRGFQMAVKALALFFD